MPERRQRRKDVTPDELDTAFDSLTRANNGEYPTYEQLIAKLGGGSHTTIARYLDRRFPRPQLRTVESDKLITDITRATVALEKQHADGLKIFEWQEANNHSLLRENGAMEDELGQALSELQEAQVRINALQAENQALLDLHRSEREANRQNVIGMAQASVRTEDYRKLRCQADGLLVRIGKLEVQLGAANAHTSLESRRAAQLDKDLQKAREEIMAMSLELGKLRGSK